MGVLDDLAAKHAGVTAPVASGGILDQLAAQHASSEPTETPDTRPRKTASDFLAEEGTLGTRVRNWGRAKGQSLGPPTRKGVTNLLRPVLEGGGAAIGATVGAAGGAATGGVTVPGLGLIPGAVAGGVAGSGLGYATGKKAADLLEGQPPPASLGQATVNTLSDVATGSTYEMGGQVVGKGVGWAAGKVKNSLSMGIPGSKTRNTFRAAEEFAEASGAGPEKTWKTTDEGFAERGQPKPQDRLTRGKDARYKRDSAVIERLNVKRRAQGLPPLQMTAGQRQGGPMLALEQSQRLKYKNKPATSGTMTFDERVQLNNAEIADAARTEMERQIPAGKPVPRTQDSSTTGARMVKAIQESEAAVKPEVKRLFSHPSFEYEMPRTEFDAAVTAVQGSNLAKDTKAAVQRVVDFAQGTKGGHHGVASPGASRTADGLKSIKETIDSEIGKAAVQGDKQTARVLGQLKQGVMDSFEAMGKAAESGDVALVDGKIVYPSRIKADIARLDEQIAERVKAAQKSTSTQGIGELGYVDRLSSERAAKELPKLQADRDRLAATLTKAQPAEDVATAYSSARKYTKEEQKDRFARDTIKGILKPGDQYGGLATAVEDIPAKIWTPSGAREFTRAMMPFKAAGATVDQAARVAAGRETAGQLAFPEMVKRFSTAAIDANTGVMSIPAALKFARNNREVLKELGLTKDLDNIIKGQIRPAIEQFLQSKGVDILNNPTMSARMAKRFVKEQFGPAVERYFGSTRAMNDWARTLEMAERSSTVQGGLNGSKTAEKLDLVAIGDKVSMFMAVLGKVGWLMNSLKSAGATVAKPIMEMSQRQKDQILQNALMDETAAKALLDVYRAKRVTDISQQSATALKQMLVQLGISMEPATPQQEDNSGQ